MKNHVEYILILMLVVCTVACNSQKRPDENDVNVKVASKEFALDNRKVISAIKEYISEHSSGSPKVFTVVIRREDLFTTSLNLHLITWYSQLKELPPYGYFKLDDHVILIYTGLEKLRAYDENFIKELNDVIGKRLENDLMPDGSPNPDFKARIYDPSTWEVKLTKDSVVVVRDNVRSILGPPIQKVIEFVPPKGEK
jgi:hypothetical protein